MLDRDEGRVACVFCKIAAGAAPASVIWEDDRFVAFLDIYPVAPGHALVMPRRHAPLLGDLDADVGPLFALAARVAAALRRCGMPCDDINLLVNDGRAAGQTVPHAHVHVLPRRRGDVATVLRKLVQRPAQRFLGGPDRGTLDRQAAAIRAALEHPALL
jgi:diadenosine tetraphosphate (Ap4A) HIT family hydrolase